MQPTASQVDKWAIHVWPGSSARARLRRAACKVLFQQKTGPAGAHSLHTSQFREYVKACSPDAWSNVDPVAGSYVKAVVLGATHIFKVRETQEDHEGSYKVSSSTAASLTAMEELCTLPQQVAIQLDVIALQLAAEDQQAGSTAQDHLEQEAPHITTDTPPHSPAADSSISYSTESSPATQQLGICLLATCLYLPTAGGSHLSELRLKAAYLLAHRPAGPLGPYSCMGSDLGSELLSVAKDAWNSIPANQSKLKVITDHCLVLEPCNGNVALRLDVHELERQAARLVADEVSMQVGMPLPDELPCMASCFCQPPFLPEPVRPAQHQSKQEPRTPTVKVQASVGQTPETWEANSALAASPEAEPTPENDVWVGEDSAQAAVTGDNHAWVQAMCLAALSLWWPSAPHVTAVVLSIVAQPNNVARLRGTRRIARLPFVIKDVTRFARNWGRPIGRAPRQMLEREPFISIRALKDVEVVQLDCEGMARSVLQAAAQAHGVTYAKTNTAMTMKAVWPPKRTHDMPVQHLHLECHALVRHVVHILGMGDGAEARESMLTQALQQLAAMVGQQWPPPGAPTPTLQTSTTATLIPAPAPAPQAQAQAQEQPESRPVPLLPLHRITQQAHAVYAAGVGAEGQLRCAAALHLAAAPVEGPLGPYSMSADQLSQILMQEQPELWHSWCRMQGGDVGVQMCMLLHGIPGLYLAAATLDEGTASERLSYAVRLEVEQLSAAAASQQQGMPAAHHRAALTAPPGFAPQNITVQPVAMGQRAASGPPPGFSGPPPAQQAQAYTPTAALQVMYEQQHVTQNDNDVFAPTPDQFRPHAENTAADMQADNDVPAASHMQGEVQQPRVSAEQICRWGQAVFPGRDALSLTQRKMVEVLAVSTECGAYTASATVLGQALSKLHGGVYQTQRSPSATSPVKNKMNLQALLRTSPAFIRLRKPPSDLWIRLDLTYLRAAAGAGGVTSANVSSSDGSMSHVTEGVTKPGGCASWATVAGTTGAGRVATHAGGTAVQSRAKAADAVIHQVDVHNPDHLASLLEKLLPGSDPYKKIKLHAVRVLVHNNQQKPWLSSKAEPGEAFTGTYFMMGPQFGLAMKSVPGFMDLPSPKLPKLFENDPYFTSMPHAGNMMVRLDVCALLEAAREAKLQLQDAAPSAPAPAATVCTGGTISYAQQAARPGVPAPKAITPQYLYDLAEKLYPRSDPFRELKLYTVQLLVHSKQQRPDANGVCQKLETLQPNQLGTCFMPAPQVGDAIARGHSPAIISSWSKLPSPKLTVLCEGDKFLSCIKIPHNIAVVLSVNALLRAAGVTQSAAALHTRMSTAPTPAAAGEPATLATAAATTAQPVYKPVSPGLLPQPATSQPPAVVPEAVQQPHLEAGSETQQQLVEATAFAHQQHAYNEQQVYAEQQYIQVQGNGQYTEQYYPAGQPIYSSIQQSVVQGQQGPQQEGRVARLYSPRDQEYHPPPPAHLAAGSNLANMSAQDVGHFNMIRVPRSNAAWPASHTTALDTPTMHAAVSASPGLPLHAGAAGMASSFHLPSQIGGPDSSSPQSMEDGTVAVKLAVPADQQLKPQVMSMQHTHQAVGQHEDDVLSYAEGAAVKLALQVLDAASPEPKKKLPTQMPPEANGNGPAARQPAAAMDTAGGSKQQSGVEEDDAELLSLLLG